MSGALRDRMTQVLPDAPLLSPHRTPQCGPFPISQKRGKRLWAVSPKSHRRDSNSGLGTVRGHLERIWRLCSPTGWRLPGTGAQDTVCITGSTHHLVKQLQ